MISLEDLASITGGRWLAEGTGAIAGASIDTRTLDAGQAFFAFPGERTDGHDFLDQAADRGAIVAIVERDVPAPAGLAVLQVRSVRSALWDLAKHYRTAISAHVIAVMGSNGKTTTVRMLQSVLGRAMRTHASARSFNNALGLPLTILNCPPDAESLICELGEGEPGALARYTSLARPDVAIVTSVGRAHVGELGGQEAVRSEFVSSIAALRDGAAVVLPEAEASLDVPVGLRVCVAKAWHEDGRVAFELADGSCWRLPVPGDHNAQNAAGVIAVARRLGVADGVISEGLERFEPADMRLSIRSIGGARVIVDCYNANPDSVSVALRTLEDLAQGERKVAVLGDMLELGEDSAAWHREMIDHATAVADECVFVGTLCQDACQDGELACFATADEAREHVAGLLQPGTIALLKGSRGIALERLLENAGESAVA